MSALAISERAADRAAVTDCWNKIGIYGDRSCPKLVEHAHCHNCEVYSAAALSLLDRQLPPQYVADWTAHFAKAGTVTERYTHSALIFRIGVDWLGLSTQVVDEVAELRTVRPLPHRRNGIVLGLVNVRGELILCVSLGKLLGLTEDKAGETTVPSRLVVLHHEGRRMAFIADEVQRTTRYRQEDLALPPATIARAAANYTKGVLPWRDRLVACLDEQVVVHSLNRSAA
jgi:chemotaxis-related protein WspD